MSEFTVWEKQKIHFWAVGGGGVKEIFVSLNPEATGGDCCSQHAPHLCMNDTLVCRRAQNLTPPPPVPPGPSPGR